MKAEFLQTKAPLFEELLRYSKQPLLPFHTPGHKQGSGLEPEWFQSGLTAGIDLTEISALDWSGALVKAQMLAADFFKADQTFFLTQGASQGIIGAMAGLFVPGDKVLVDRNCHLSVIKGIIIAGLSPIFIETEFLPDWGIPGGVKDLDLQTKINANPDFKGLIVTNPTYQGIATPVRNFRAMIGANILMIDEAHGGHLEWSGLSGYNAWEAADLWVQGTHKIMGSFTQTGMLHLRSERVKPELIQQGLDLISTTSPSYILLASLDSNRRFLYEKGSQLFRKRLPELNELRSRIAVCEGVHILEKPVQVDAVVDPWKIILSFGPAGISGYQAASILEREFRIQPEYADVNQVTCLIGPWQDQADFEALYRAVVAVSNRKAGGKRSLSMPPPKIPSLSMPVREAAFAPKNFVSLENAIGRVSGGIIAPYPPGVPLLIPGELIGKDELEYIKESQALGGIVRGLDSGNKIAVVKENR